MAEKFPVLSNQNHDKKEIKRDFCEDIDPDVMPEKLEEIEIQIDRLKQRWSEFTYLIGQRLQHIRDHKLFQHNNYPDFKTYVTIALKMSENNAYYYIAIYEYFTNEQAKKAGSKLKLIIPILNKVKKSPGLSRELKEMRLRELRDELFFLIYNKTYREAEKLLHDVRLKYFNPVKEVGQWQRVVVKKDKIIIHEADPETQEQLIRLINEFYS